MLSIWTRPVKYLSTEFKQSEFKALAKNKLDVHVVSMSGFDFAVNLGKK